MSRCRAMTGTPQKHPPPWLFGIVGIPYGVGGAFVGVVMPFLASRAKIDLDEIGWFVTLLFVPPMFQFLYAPIVDIGPKRKHWLVILAALGAVCFAGAFVMPLPEHKTAFLLCGFLGQMISGLCGSCNGGLLALTMPDEKRGQAAAWLNIGNLSGGGIAAWLTIEMLSRDVPVNLIGIAYGAMLLLPAFAILVVDEPTREHRPPRVVFSDMLRGVGEVLFSKSGITGIAMCISPVGTAALANYFSGMKDAFGASEQLVGFVSGPANVVLTAIGAAIGGWLCDLYNRRALYLLSGVLTAVCGIVMALAPHDADTYLWGVMTYALITGFCYSAFTAVVLETIGQGGKAASTQYALFVAAGNIAIAYVGFVDTRFGGHEPLTGLQRWRGYLAHVPTRPLVEHVIAADASLNLIGVAILAVVFWKLGSFGRARLRAKAVERSP
ncbi:MAG: major facilitator superfamily 1 [Myxococcales bacterium]|nr:major facilitator superfamily 1 [Myxococcales bacterium]